MIFTEFFIGAGGQVASPGRQAARPGSPLTSQARAQGLASLTGPRHPPAVTAWAGMFGPVCFVGGWVAAAALRPGYSSVQQAISQLARQGAPHRALMTVAFVAYAVAMPIFALALVPTGRLLALSVTLAGLATLGVACCPLSASGGGTGDLVHGGFATAGYVATVASAGLGAIALRRRHRHVAAAASAALAVVAAASLALTTTGHLVGLFQRTGLTLVDGWFVVTAIAILGRHTNGVAGPGDAPGDAGSPAAAVSPTAAG